MRLIRICEFLLIFIIISVLPIDSFSQSKIYGKVTSTNNSSNIYYFEPFNNYYNDEINPHILNVVNDTFSINVKNRQPGFIVLYIDAYAFYFGITGCDTIYLQFDYEDIISGKSKNIQVNGKNKLGHSQFNELYYEPMEKYAGIHDLLGKIRSIPKDAIFDSLENVVATETFPFKRLYLDGNIDFTFYKMTTYSIQTAVIYEFLKPFVRKTSLTKWFTSIEIDSLYNRIFKEYKPDDTYHSIGVRSYNFTDEYYRFLFRGVLANDSLKRRMVDSMINGKSDVRPMEDFIPYVIFSNDNFRENIWGKQLYGVKRMFPDEVPLSDLHAFSFFYPNSVYLPYLQKIYEGDSKAAGELKLNIEIIDSSGAINNLKDLTSSIIDGSNLYFIDLWASWCVPCKEQFVFNDKLDTLLAKNNITKIYIAIDETISRKSWISDLKRYNLTGKHFIAGQNLKNDINKLVFKRSENFAIPRYFLLNKNGIIVNDNLARPSEMHTLEHQITDLTKVQ